jgi:S1-C subfamily serine protease
VKFVAIACCLLLSGLHSRTAVADLADTIERVKPSILVIGLFNKTASPQFQMRGTGFVVGTGNIAATNSHVLPENLDRDTRIAVLQSSGLQGATQIRLTEILARDKDHDIALLRFDGPPLPSLKLIPSDTVREGQGVAFTGFPIGGALGFSPVTHRGTISSITPIGIPGGNSTQLNGKLIQQLKRGTFKVFQLDATAYPGNSGSPIFDTDTGDVIGIINMVFIKGSKEAALTSPSGISYAIPSNYLLQLMSAGSPRP